MSRAFQEVFGISDGLQGVRLGAGTAFSQVREALARQGVVQNGHWSQAIDSFTQAYIRNLQEALAESTEGCALPGAADFLRWIAGQPGLHAGLATGNFRCCALLKLEYFGLLEYVSEGGFGDGHELRVDVVATAARRCEAAFGEVFAPGDVFVVGDTPYDIEAGRVNGFRTIGVATGSSSMDVLATHQPTLLLRDLTVSISTLGSVLAVPEWSGFMGGLAWGAS